MRRVLIIFFAVLVFALSILFVLDRTGFVDVPKPSRWFSQREPRIELPEAQPYAPQPPPVTELPAEPTPPQPPPPVLSEEINLAVPFTSQAPHQNWDEAHEEFCEEASVLMAARFIQGRAISSPDDAEAALQEIRKFEEERFGYYKDTTAEETAVILREFYSIPNVSVAYDPTISAIKNELAQGKVVIVPAAGRQLGNPYFTPPGPVYHMLVIKGYTLDGRLITNDPGTRRGANYIYNAQTLLNAVHDWNGGDVENGRKVMIVVG